MDRLAALNAGQSVDFWRRDNPKCPHCGEVFSVSKNELWSLYEEGEHDVDCGDCGLNFMVSTHVTFSFSTNEQEDEQAVTDHD